MANFVDGKLICTSCRRPVQAVTEGLCDECQAEHNDGSTEGAER